MVERTLLLLIGQANPNLIAWLMHELPAESLDLGATGRLERQELLTKRRKMVLDAIKARENRLRLKGGNHAS